MAVRAKNELQAFPVALQGEGIPRERNKQIVFVDIDDVLFVIMARRLFMKILLSLLIAERDFKRGKVYIRTRKDVFQSEYRTLAEIHAELDERFMRVHVSIIANLHAVRRFMKGKGDAWLGYDTDRGSENVAIADGRLKAVRAYLRTRSTRASAESTDAPLGV